MNADVPRMSLRRRCRRVVTLTCTTAALMAATGRLYLIGPCSSRRGGATPHARAASSRAAPPRWGETARACPWGKSCVSWIARAMLPRRDRLHVENSLCCCSVLLQPYSIYYGSILWQPLIHRMLLFLLSSRGRRKTPALSAANAHLSSFPLSRSLARSARFESNECSSLLPGASASRAQAC